MTVNRQLLARFLRENPFQPATGLWRAVEIAFVQEHGLPVGARGLDIGTGDGRLLGVLLDGMVHRPEVVGVDVDPLEIAAARASRNYGRLHVASADDLPEADASFDWVFSNSTLEHIGPIEGTLAEISRVLRPRGTFVFTVPSEEFHDCLRGPLFGSRPSYLRMIDRRCAHLRYWDEARWRLELDRVGLVLVKTEGYLSLAETRRWETISRFTAGVLHQITRRHPIVIQRRLGMRRGQRLPNWAATLLGGLLTLGLDADVSGNGLRACRYMVARRRADDLPQVSS